jgi:glutaredoxin
MEEVNMEILVIGPEPPCVRCLNTARFAKEVAEQFSGKVTVRKIETHSEEAQKYGKVEGGGSIAEIEKVNYDSEGFKKLMQEAGGLMSDEEGNKSSIKGKLQDIQEKVTPIVEKAKEAGYLMTPVVVVNGKVKSMGYVPDKEEIRKWVESELGN